MANNFDKKWSELSKADSRKMKEKYGSKGSWQDAKARSMNYADHEARRQAKQERRAARNPESQTTTNYVPPKETATSTNTAPTNEYTEKYGSGLKGYDNWWQQEGLSAAKARNNQYGKDNPTSGIVSGGGFGYSKMGDDGLYTFDASKPIQSFDPEMLKKFGIGAGDKIFSPRGYKSAGNNKFTTDGTISIEGLESGIVVPKRIGENVGAFGR
jgi:hypothetical protein